jgi:lipopolysaccharide/colanic/teichoic acid biosynthesis glycosyltransferase
MYRDCGAAGRLRYLSSARRCAAVGWQQCAGECEFRDASPPARNSVPVSAAARPVAHADSTTITPSSLIFREGLRYVRYRRLFDIAVGIIVLAVSAAILLMACLAIIIEDGGPAFFCQRRVGRFGLIFVMYQLRTMRKEKCADRFAPSSRFDPRITRSGHWLRRFSIDEIPQLVNVIRGDRTLVGPRPEMPFIVRKYEDWQNLRHLVTPGITGFGKLGVVSQCQCTIQKRRCWTSNTFAARRTPLMPCCS